MQGLEQRSSTRGLELNAKTRSTTSIPPPSRPPTSLKQPPGAVVAAGPERDLRRDPLAFRSTPHHPHLQRRLQSSAQSQPPASPPTVPSPSPPLPHPPTRPSRV